MNGEELLHFNGINGETGGYLFPPMKPGDLLAEAKKEENDEDQETQDALRERRNRDEEAALGTVYDVKDPADLAQSGWGVIFAAADPQAAQIKQALGKLLSRRQEQAAKNKAHYYRECTYYPGKSKVDFLQDNDADPFGQADPEKMPYYLLIVGDPALIPYSFQYQLDVQYAVGRIHFRTVSDYEQYAANVVQAETNKLPRRAAFFGVRNPEDMATKQSAERLVGPLVGKLRVKRPNWQIDPYLGDGDAKSKPATKENLLKLFGAQQAPSLLFTASHGVAFPGADLETQLARQGALLCQDWPGKLDWGKKPLEDKLFLSAKDLEDLKDTVQLSGLIAVHFACYGAGTPSLNDFTHHRGFTEALEIAKQPFVARLPQQELLRGALAAIGHVERAWTYSFSWDSVAETQVFEDLFKELMDGNPVGLAMERFNSRYASLATNLTDLLNNKIRMGKATNTAEFARDWTANNDARNYVIVGDPAARLYLLEEGGTPQKRSPIELIISD